jgi:hypothetical protein
VKVRRNCLFLLAALLLLTACGLLRQDEMGYVQIQLDRPNAADPPALLLGSTSLEFVKGREIFLRLPAGVMALTDEGWFGWFGAEYCRVVIGKNRVTTLTLVGGNPPICRCADRDPLSPANKPVCK